jgi:hypothetical protein
MFLLPLLLIAAAAYVVYRVLHRAPQLTAGTVHELDSHPVPRRPFWPTTIEGKLGIIAFALAFAPIALVNVVQVPFLSWAVLVAALALTADARFVKHDRSTSVLIVFVVTAIGALASVVFIAGEVFIGHD